MESLLKHGSFSVLMLKYKQVLNNEQEKSFGRTVRVMQRRDGIIILRHNDDIWCHVHTDDDICCNVSTIYKFFYMFSKTCWHLVSSCKFPIVSSNSFLRLFSPL